MSAAVKAINENENSGVACECVGYLLEELRDEKNAAAFKKDVEEANVFIGSLIFVQELAEQVKEVVEAERDRLDAVLIFPSMPEVMRLNKVGGFTMASLGQSKSVVSEFMKKKKADDGSSFEEAMLKLLRTLPKVLKYLPGMLRRLVINASMASRHTRVVDGVGARRSPRRRRRGTRDFERGDE
jgi:magnesium chelatase subunit H